MGELDCYVNYANLTLTSRCLSVYGDVCRCVCVENVYSLTVLRIVYSMSFILSLKTNLCPTTPLRPYRLTAQPLCM